MEAVTESQLVVGALSYDQQQDDWPFWSPRYLTHLYPYKYVFDIGWVDSDVSFKLPGVYPTRDLIITRDPFPCINSVHQVNVGALLAETEDDVVLLVTCLSGAKYLVGLLRAPRWMLRRSFEGGQVNEAVFGWMSRADLEIWIKGIPQDLVRIVFPYSYRSPPTRLYDVKRRKLVADIPASTTHFDADVGDMSSMVHEVTAVVSDQDLDSRSTVLPRTSNGMIPSGSASSSTIEAISSPDSYHASANTSSSSVSTATISSTPSLAMSEAVGIPLSPKNPGVLHAPVPVMTYGNFATMSPSNIPSFPDFTATTSAVSSQVSPDLYYSSPVSKTEADTEDRFPTPMPRNKVPSSIVASSRFTVRGSNL
ncbi:uncharacterized protein STEHIDRAFT_160755 [Stereum hirsutum FP-91666 SS1]|uniref:uncharacterized protein n=1 Tax=Stereum hirsutum (strain FP-91666) TaxID=721885 RepID=UPI0004449A6D|nr:uncharacterized protein STEHIDRAFT_160755 [Stereum hirsutum FP-91666 SS1]EIM83156.1 hypothetical protein STEHIDRAFT_160755 [Stereum hirsutum FP-91666 SS1]